MSPRNHDSLEIARQVGQEVLKERFDPGVWATAVASSSARHEEVLATYVRLRIGWLKSQRNFLDRKLELLEARRQTSFVDVMRNPSKSLGRNTARNPLPPLNLPCMGILLISASGLVASLSRLGGGGRWRAIEGWMPALALLCGLALVGAALLMRLLLPRGLVKGAWDPGLKLVCALVSAGSLYCGWKLMSHTPPEVIQQLLKRDDSRTKPGFLAPAEGFPDRR